jgi:hypothetical protein
MLSSRTLYDTLDNKNSFLLASAQERVFEFVRVGLEGLGVGVVGVGVSSLKTDAGRYPQAQQM